MSCVLVEGRPHAEGRAGTFRAYHCAAPILNTQPELIAIPCAERLRVCAMEEYSAESRNPCHRHPPSETYAPPIPSISAAYQRHKMSGRVCAASCADAQSCCGICAATQRLGDSQASAFPPNLSNTLARDRARNSKCSAAAVAHMSTQVSD